MTEQLFAIGAGLAFVWTVGALVALWLQERAWKKRSMRKR